MLDLRFPELSIKQMKNLKLFDQEEHFYSPTRLFSLGDTNHDFFIVLKGSVSITDSGDDSKEIVKHSPNQFSGHNGMLSPRRALFHATSYSDTSLLRIKPELQRAYQKEINSSKTTLQA